MVKIFSTEHTYQHPWSHVTSAFWRKYPNPMATHVKQIDCYERKLIPVASPSAGATATATVAAAAPKPFNPSSLASHQTLHKTKPKQHMMLVTNRLVACESPIPQWMSSLGIPTQCYVAETCVVDPVTKEMVIKSRNISGSSIMTIEETCRYTAHPENKQWTHYSQSAKITAFLPFISSNLEAFSFNSMHEKSKKGLEAIEILCERIRNQGLDSITSLTATFDAFVDKLHIAAGAAAIATPSAALPIASIEAVANGKA